SDEDLPYEEEILRNPYSVKHWLRYIDHKKTAPKHGVNIIYERALKELPGSYKLWYNYLRTRRKQIKHRCIIDPSYEEVNNAFERALVFMHKMPRIWMDYCTLLTDQCKITRTRKVFDRALRALPVTQHHRIWPYLKLSPESAEEYVDYLTETGKLDEAAIVLAKIVNDENFISQHGKSKHQLWNELCELISKNPQEVRSLNVDAIIRGGLRRYTDQLGHLWNSLANYYVRSGLFERARDIYEEAIQTVTTELSLSKRMEEIAKKTNPTEDEDVDLELRLARFEYLMERRLLLLNSVLLRQNPHNVQEWHKRVQLYEGKPHEIINTYTEAVQTVDPKMAVGKLHTLWVEFAKFYEKNGQIDDARLIFEKATHVSFVKVADLATVWCEWTEMEIRNENYEEALRLMHKATALPSRKIAYHDDNETVQARLYKSLKVWSMYADLEESFGTFKSCKAVYDRIIDLKIATPQIIINYGVFLEENNYFEEAFRAYEKGISLFKWPNVYDIWNTYLTKFLKQEEYGMARHAMAVYDRATKAVPEHEMFDVFNIYIKRAAEIYGIPKTRQIYEKAIGVLPEDKTREMCVRFADMETKLGEIDRARAIYAHCSQICDPRVTNEFWQIWKEFEAMYNTQVNMMSAQMLSSAGSTAGTVADLAPGVKDGMRLLEAKAVEMAGASTSGNIMFIDIDDDDDDEMEEEEVPVEKQSIPSEVFGSLKKTIEED
ncbi:hypothetical protein NQ318_014270, partial [Aromia moschata]